MKREEKNRRILRALYFSYDARLEPEKIQQNHEHMIVHFEFVDDKRWDTQCFLMLTKEGELVIAFRGSQQARDWVTDFAGWSVPYGNDKTKIRLHWGFSQAYGHHARGRIHRFINMYRNEIKWTTVCGFSLGGALATLCAVDLQYNGLIDAQKMDCLPAGNPRVGNEAFVNSFNKRIPRCWRTYHRNDLVPNLPPYVMGYRHAGKKNPWATWNPLSGIINFFRSKELRKRDSFDLADIVNHEINAYILHFEKKFD
jgi:hypothetical protein